MPFNSFEDMPVWQRAMTLAEQVFLITEGLPKKEDYGLVHKFGAQPSRCQATLQKGSGESTRKTSCSFTTLQEDHSLKQKVIFTTERELGIFQHLHALNFIALQMRRGRA